jgi:hypothetical protein
MDADETIDTYDPLRDEFRKLEQSACDHDAQIVGYVHGAALSVCTKCGHGRDRYDAAVISSWFLPAMCSKQPAPPAPDLPA